ncbi:MAG TPA: hypothetical protein VFJ15_07150 [Oleiagrimonas sp.]|nr:hypothetical protein [Oleiagrimonas sp.]
MFASALLSLSASVLITAGTFVSLTVGYAGVSTPAPPSHTLDGLPVTDLPGITVYPSRTAALARPQEAGSIALISQTRMLNQLVSTAATQVANSHLGMPYYSFGSGSEANGED